MPETPIHHNIRATTRSTACSTTPVPGCGPPPRRTTCRRSPDRRRGDATSVDRAGGDRGRDRGRRRRRGLDRRAGHGVGSRSPRRHRRRLDARLRSRFAAGSGARRSHATLRDTDPPVASRSRPSLSSRSPRPTSTAPAACACVSSPRWAAPTRASPTASCRTSRRGPWRSPSRRSRSPSVDSTQRDLRDGDRRRPADTRPSTLTQARWLNTAC